VSKEPNFQKMVTKDRDGSQAKTKYDLWGGGEVGVVWGGIRTYEGKGAKSDQRSRCRRLKGFGQTWPEKGGGDIMLGGGVGCR